MKNSSGLITNDIEYVIENMGKKVESFNAGEILDQFVTMDDIENPTTNITPKLIREVMDGMVWPSMGKTQAAVNKKAFTSYNVVIRHFKKEGETPGIHTEAEAREAIKVVLRRREFTDN